MGVCLALATMYYTFRPLSFSADKELMASDSMMTAVIFGSLYWITGISAILYPGSKGLDPEFGEKWFPQLPLFMALLASTCIGGWLEGGFSV